MFNYFKIRIHICGYCHINIYIFKYYGVVILSEINELPVAQFIQKRTSEHP